MAKKPNTMTQPRPLPNHLKFQHAFDERRNVAMQNCFSRQIANL